MLFTRPVHDLRVEESHVHDHPQYLSIMRSGLQSGLQRLVIRHDVQVYPRVPALDDTQEGDGDAPENTIQLEPGGGPDRHCGRKCLVGVSHWPMRLQVRVPLCEESANTVTASIDPDVVVFRRIRVDKEEVRCEDLLPMSQLCEFLRG